MDRMEISELIEKLQAIAEKHGSDTVCIVTHYDGDLLVLVSDNGKAMVQL